MSFEGRDIISIKDFTREEIDHILGVSELMEPLTNSKSDLLKGKILGNLFLEPSTRTRLSFETAIHRLGGECITISEEKTSSIEKGESLADTIMTVEKYVDTIVLRHPMEGAARMASEVSNIPIISAGSGAEEHPTQAFLDLYTIKRELGKVDNMKIAFFGDLKFGRTTQSLAYALSNYNVDLFLVSPELLKMRREIIDDIKGKIKVSEPDNLETIISEIDVLYVTRIQKERFSDPEEYERVKGTYRVSMETASKLKKTAIIMHPLPRVEEIAPEVDQTSHAKYFKEVWYGLVTRMGILSLILGAIE